MRRLIVTVAGVATAGLLGACAPAYVARPAYVQPVYDPYYGRRGDERHEAREHEEHEHHHGDDRGHHGDHD